MTSSNGELAALVAERTALRTRGRRVVFTNGCFDLMHPGHIQLLEAARSLGELLVVGLNADVSVRALKGPTRPVMPEAERREILEALECVDRVVLFREITPLALITALVPDVLVKGADWGQGEIVGRDIVESSGGRVVRLPLVPGRSTTGIIERIRSK